MPRHTPQHRHLSASLRNSAPVVVIADDDFGAELFLAQGSTKTVLFEALLWSVRAPEDGN